MVAAVMMLGMKINILKPPRKRSRMRESVNQLASSKANRICGMKLAIQISRVLPKEFQKSQYTGLAGSMYNLKLSNPIILLLLIFPQPMASDSEVRKVNIIGYS